MHHKQIFRVRRQYNQWVNNQTLKITPCVLKYAALVAFKCGDYCAGRYFILNPEAERVLLITLSFGVANTLVATCCVALLILLWAHPFVITPPNTV